MSDLDARRRLARLRLASQRLTRSPADSPASAVRWMLAMQGQDYAGAKWSVGLRTGATEAEVEAALDEGEVVRSWPMRGTLHLVAAEDLPWMLALTAERAMTSAAQRRAVVGLTLDDLERARVLVADALPGRSALTRALLLEAIAAGGVRTDGQRGYHLLWFLAQSGMLVLGPTSGREQAFARLDAWVPSPRRLDRDEALGELARRYFESHGPAGVEDLVRWSGLTTRAVRRGIAVAGAALATLDLGGRPLWLGAAALEAVEDTAADGGGVLLLPGFDEYLLGYKDRGAMLAPEHSQAIVPGNNGMFRATVVVDGEVRGVWTKRAGARGMAVELQPFGPLSESVTAGVERAADAYGRYLGVPVRVTGAR